MSSGQCRTAGLLVALASCFLAAPAAAQMGPIDNIGIPAKENVSATYNLKINAVGGNCPSVPSSATLTISQQGERTLELTLDGETGSAVYHPDRSEFQGLLTEFAGAGPVAASGSFSDYQGQRTIDLNLRFTGRDCTASGSASIPLADAYSPSPAAAPAALPQPVAQPMATTSDSEFRQYIGTYSLKLTVLGPDCIGDQGTGSLDIVSINGDRIALSMDGMAPGEGKFFPATLNYKVTLPSGHMLYGFFHHFDSTNEDQALFQITYPAGTECSGSGTAIKPGSAAQAANSGGSFFGAGWTKLALKALAIVAGIALGWGLGMLLRRMRSEPKSTGTPVPANAAVPTVPRSGAAGAVAKPRAAWEWALLPLRKYAEFAGRAPRAEYWWYVLMILVASILIGVVQSALGIGGGYGLGTLRLFFMVAVFVPGLAVAVRRLHDTDRSGVTLLVGLIPIIGGLILLVFLAQRGSPGPNRHGEAP